MAFNLEKLLKIAKPRSQKSIEKEQEWLRKREMKKSRKTFSELGVGDTIYRYIIPTWSGDENEEYGKFNVCSLNVMEIGGKKLYVFGGRWEDSGEMGEVRIREGCFEDTRQIEIECILSTQEWNE